MPSANDEIQFRFWLTSNTTNTGWNATFPIDNGWWVVTEQKKTPPKEAEANPEWGEYSL